MDTPSFLAEDRGPSILATASIMIILCTCFVGLRYYARYLTSTSFNVQDVIAPFALIAEIGLCVTGIIMVEKADTGRHMAYIVTADPARITEHFKGIMILEVLHPAAVAFPKLIVVIMYLYILTNKYERMVAKVLAALISATWLAYTVTAMFQCTPFAFNWDKMIAGGKCFDVQAYANSSSVPNIITDIAVLILPIRTVWGLKISIARRVGLLLIFLTGSLGIIASIIRTVVFARTLAEAGPLVDSTFNHVSLVNWTILEPGIYLLSACALSFKPLFRTFAKAVHLQDFITNTKSAPQRSKSHVTKKSTSTTQTDLRLQRLYKSGEGRFHKLSGESDVSSKRMEVLVTTTVDIETEEEVHTKDIQQPMSRRGAGNMV
ncbi:integral membrane protein [Paraphoma chrysanthemicola]|uniref:Integral membrane protein n=1 Tax=Paraphoma chrysanthemicola TaxID=798071 RepID=A0A8K0RGR8_9PLEO|nr:integral membrane protein [Paraphoma chrysanthemicola]